VWLCSTISPCIVRAMGNATVQALLTHAPWVREDDAVVPCTQASTALAPWGKGHKGQRPGWVLLGSGLDDAGKVLLKQLATVSGMSLICATVHDPA
jgi:hypothetical protein